MSELVQLGIPKQGRDARRPAWLRVKVLEPSLAALFLGLAFALMVVVTRLIRRRAPAKVNRVFRRLQLVSGSFVIHARDERRAEDMGSSRSHFRAIYARTSRDHRSG